MGLCDSKFDDDIRKQEEYVNRHMKDPEVIKLSKMRDTFFHPSEPKYNRYQLKACLRQKYHNGTTRKPNSYILDQDLRNVGMNMKRNH